MVSGNKDKIRLDLTSTGTSVSAQGFFRINAFGLGSNCRLGMFRGIELVVEFFLKTFHLIQRVRKDNLSLNSIIVSSIKGMLTHRNNGAVLGSNPEFGISVD